MVQILVSHIHIKKEIEYKPYLCNEYILLKIHRVKVMEATAPIPGKNDSI